MSKRDTMRPRITKEEYSILQEIRRTGVVPQSNVDSKPKEDKIIEDLKKILMNRTYSVEDLSNRFNVPPKEIRNRIDLLKEQKFAIQEEEDGEHVTISTELKQGGKHLLNPDMWLGDKLQFGFTADNHLCSHYERLDLLNLLYDIYEKEGIQTVYNAGNWIDGEARFNKNEIHVKGMTKQIEYAVKNYPYRKGIETHFVSGDDHEGWYNQREGINIGEYFQMKREQAGMFDLKHLGYLEADIALNDESFEHQSWLRVLHPGGGSAYATSYAAQKIIESLQGGEKPNILLIGHYHKLLYAYIRNVHTIQCGTTSDQSLFMRKQKIEAHVGGGIVTLFRAPDGIINGCSVRFITAFDKKFYIGKDKYWK